MSDETSGVMDVTGRDNVWVLQLRTEGIWWLVGCFSTKIKAETYQKVNYPEMDPKDVRVLRRMVR